MYYHIYITCLEWYTRIYGTLIMHTLKIACRHDSNFVSTRGTEGGRYDDLGATSDGMVDMMMIFGFQVFRVSVW